MSRCQLELIRWSLALTAFAAIVGGWVFEPKGGWALLLFFFVVLTGIPAAMLSLHLHPPKFFRHLERPKK